MYWTPGIFLNDIIFHFVVFESEYTHIVEVKDTDAR